MTKTSKEKRRLTKEEIQKAREVNLVDYCLTNNIPLIRTHTRNPSLAEHDSLVFYPDNKDRQWNRHSTGQGGDAIAFIQFYESRHLPEGETVSFQYAVNKLLDNDYKSVPKIRPPVPDFEYQNYEVKDFTKAKEYLVNERGIDEAFVSVLIDEGIIAQNNRNNIVFKWIDYDQDGKIVGANEQGTGRTKEGERSFKKTQRHSTRGKGFNLRIGEPENIKFFESAIDLLSYADIHQEQLENEWLVSMEGLKHTVVMETLNSCSRYSKNHEDYHIHSVTFCVDNDEAGRTFADKYIGKLTILDPNGNKDFTLDVPENSKDWNDELKKQRQDELGGILMVEEEEKKYKVYNFETIREEMKNIIENHYDDFIKAELSIEKGIDDKELLDRVYEEYMNNKGMESHLNDNFDEIIDEYDQLFEFANEHNLKFSSRTEYNDFTNYVFEHEKGTLVDIDKSIIGKYDLALSREEDDFLPFYKKEDMDRNDLRDTLNNVNFQPVIEKEGEIKVDEKHIYIYSGFGEPEKVESFEEIAVESNHLGDVTEEFQEEVDWHMDVDTLEELQENQFFAEYGVWINPTKEQLEEYNESIGLDKDEYLQDFEGHEQLFEDRETTTYLDLDDELEL